MMLQTNRLVPILAIAFAFALPDSAVAQKPAPAVVMPARVLAPAGYEPLPYDSVQVGMLTRLKAIDLIYGRTAVLQARFGDTIVVRGLRQREVVRVPADRIESMEVSTGRGWSADGAVRGGVIGFGAAVVFARVAQYMFEPASERTRQPCPALLVDVACGMSPTLLFSSVAVGILGGVAIGGKMGDERWRVVRVP